MRYKVVFPGTSIKNRFEQALRNIPNQDMREKIMCAVGELAKNPRPYGKPKIKPPLFVYSYTAQYRIRVGDYRVLYDVDDKKKKVWVLALRKRGERTYK